MVTKVYGKECSSLEGEVEFNIKRSLSGSLPYDSAICCCVEKSDQGLMGTVQVRSAQGRFSGVGSGKSIEELVEDFRKVLTPQIQEWRKSRTQNKGNPDADWTKPGGSASCSEMCKKESCPLIHETGVELSHFSKT